MFDLFDGAGRQNVALACGHAAFVAVDVARIDLARLQDRDRAQLGSVYRSVWVDRANMIGDVAGEELFDLRP